MATFPLVVGICCSPQAGRYRPLRAASAGGHGGCLMALALGQFGDDRCVAPPVDAIEQHQYERCDRQQRSAWSMGDKQPERRTVGDGRSRSARYMAREIHELQYKAG